MNPNFEKSITIGYYFERCQPLKFELVDDEGKHPLMGSVETTLGAVIGAPNQTFVAKLTIPGSSDDMG